MHEGCCVGFFLVSVQWNKLHSLVLLIHCLQENRLLCFQLSGITLVLR